MIGDETGEYETNPDYFQMETKWQSKVTIRYRFVAAAQRSQYFGVDCTEVRMAGAMNSFFINVPYNEFLEHWLHND